MSFYPKKLRKIFLTLTSFSSNKPNVLIKIVQNITFRLNKTENLVYIVVLIYNICFQPLNQLANTLKARHTDKINTMETPKKTKKASYKVQANYLYTIRRKNELEQELEEKKDILEIIEHNFPGIKKQVKKLMK